METMKPADYKHLLVSLKTKMKKKQKNQTKKIKELEDEIKKLKLELASQITQ